MEGIFKEKEKKQEGEPPEKGNQPNGGVSEKGRKEGRVNNIQSLSQL